ncbi:hypothetical protein K501DRAFT_234134, partial [Backusella circina FSU 941]
MSSEIINDSLRELLSLLEQRRENSADSELESRFFNDTLMYLMSDGVDHWFCNKDILPIARESLWLFSLPEHEHINEFKNKLDKQLKACTYCAQAYHLSKEPERKRYELMFTKDAVKDFFGSLEKFDLKRVNASLTLTTPSTFQLTDPILCAICEIIFSPGLLGHNTIDQLFCQVFERIQQTGFFPTFNTDSAPYIYRLSLYHLRVVRFWTRKLLEKFVTEDKYTFSDETFLQIEDVVLSIIQQFTTEEDQFNETVLKVCPFQVTGDLGEFWKAFRIIVGASSAQVLEHCLSESNVSMPQLIRIQLESSAEWLGEILKTMTTMLLKLQGRFWGEVHNDSTPYYDIVKQICEHHVFQSAMKIAREGNTGKILQRDGTPYPEDKLMAKIKSMLEWIYPYWSSLRQTPVENDITHKILDTTFGYFQMSTWGVMSRAYCAELGLQIVDQCLADDSIPIDKIEEYASKMVGFATTVPEKLPALVRNMPIVARSVIAELMERDTVGINTAFHEIYRDAALRNDSVKLSQHTAIWKQLRHCFNNEEELNSAWVFNLLLKCYGNIAAIDIPNFISTRPLYDNSEEGALILKRVNELHSILLGLLKRWMTLSWDIKKERIADPQLLKPFVQLLCSPYPDLRANVKYFLNDQSTQKSDAELFVLLFKEHTFTTLDAFNEVLREFVDLTKTKVDVFRMVPCLMECLLHLVQTLTKGDYLEKSADGAKKDEEDAVKTFWDVCWKTVSIVLSTALKWAESYKPKDVVDTIIPVLDIAIGMMNGRRAFGEFVQKVTSSQDEQLEEEVIRYDSMNSAVDSLSNWVYVTRNELIARLVPLTVGILKVLKSAKMKISVEAYDRLMTAATGVNASRLSPENKESLFMALSAHEPTNVILMDGSDDDENMSWEPITVGSLTKKSEKASSSKPRQITLNESFQNVNLNGSPVRKPNKSKISSYFNKNQEVVVLDGDDLASETIVIKEEDDVKPGISEEDNFDDFDMDMDFSQIPDEWLEGREKQPEQPRIIKAPERDANATSKATTNAPRVYVQSKQPTFAVTTNGRRLRPPSMGFSKLKSLRQEFKAERRLVATAKSPSAAGVVRNRFNQGSKGGDSGSDSGSESESDSDDGDNAGLLGLISDMDSSESRYGSVATNGKESSSVKALFESKPKRTIKIIETPQASKMIQERRMKANEMEKRRHKFTPNLDKLYKQILSWDITKHGDCPPDVQISSYRSIPNRFDTYDAYFGYFEPLLMNECWSQVERARETLTEADVLDRCTLNSRCHINDFVDVSFSVPLSLVTNNLQTDDLVCIANHFGPDFFAADTQDSRWKGKAFLGKIMTITQTKNMGDITIRTYFTADKITLLNSLAPKTPWRMLRIMTLTTILREYAALQGFQYYDLANDILSPKLSDVPKPSQAMVDEYCTNYKVNQSQAEAIASAITKKKGFSLIQGPPGTGKTKTILSLIVSLLDSNRGHTIKNPTQPYGSGKILVCAPSNAAVDEIAKRLKDGVMTGHGLKQPSIVRIGVSDSVNASVKDLLLDRLIEHEMDASGDNDEKNGKFSARRSHLHNEIRDIQIGLDDVERDIAQAGSDMAQMAVLREKRKSLLQKRNKNKMMLKDIYEDQRDHSHQLEVSRLRARQKVFANADVVCATLSGSGHDMLTSMCVSFDTVIVDEAAQSIEISSLIPLKYDTQRCILVGDPNQLPPTVISVVASKFNYQQSLFMRLENSIGDEVNLLRVQYRMHPEISKFPSQIFYKSKLSDGPDMASVTSAIWHHRPEFPPYSFFNVLDGHEKVGRGKSIFN